MCSVAEGNLQADAVQLQACGGAALETLSRPKDRADKSGKESSVWVYGGYIPHIVPYKLLLEVF